MKLKYSLLKALQEADGFLSGEKIAARFSVTRAAVWKAAESLKKEGYPIEASPNKGYRLRQKQPSEAWQNVFHLASVTSTNDYAKGLKDEDLPAVVIADCQTAGRARHGEAFPSPEAEGLYFSLALRVKIPLERVKELTDRAVSRVQACFGGRRQANTLRSDSGKIAGVLTETVCDMDDTERVVVGVGVYAALSPEERQKTALSLADEIRRAAESLSR